MTLQWHNNITALKLIEKTDPVFYKILVENAKLLLANDYCYQDRFYGNNRLTKLQDILIVQTYMDGLLLTSIDTDQYKNNIPLAWICPGLYNDSNAQSKNPLCRENDTLYLSDVFIGCHCFFEEMKQLRQGLMISQENGEIVEKVFGLPVEKFIEILLNA